MAQCCSQIKGEAMTSYEYENETDEERRIRFRKTEWYGIKFEGYKDDKLQEGWVRVSGDNHDLIVMMYCMKNSWDIDKDINIIDTMYLGIEH